MASNPDSISKHRARASDLPFQNHSIERLLDTFFNKFFSFSFIHNISSRSGVRSKLLVGSVFITSFRSLLFEQTQLADATKSRSFWLPTSNQVAFLPLLGHVQKDEFTLTLGAIAIPAATVATGLAALATVVGGATVAFERFNGTANDSDSFSSGVSNAILEDKFGTRFGCC